MTEAIFNKGNIFTRAFRNEVYDGVLFMLELSNLLSARAGISGLVRGNENPRETLNKPNTNQSFVITLSMMAELINRNGLDPNVLKSFLLEVNAPDILTQDAEKNPLYTGQLLSLTITSTWLESPVKAVPLTTLS